MSVEQTNSKTKNVMAVKEIRVMQGSMAAQFDVYFIDSYDRHALQ